MLQSGAQPPDLLLPYRKYQCREAHGCARAAIIRNPGAISGLQEFPEIDLAANRVGIFGEMAELNAPVQPGDRVEIYRPLRADPKEVRRGRTTCPEKKKS